MREFGGFFLSYHKHVLHLLHESFRQKVSPEENQFLLSLARKYGRGPFNKKFARCSMWRLLWWKVITSDTKTLNIHQPLDTHILQGDGGRSIYAPDHIHRYVCKQFFFGKCHSRRKKPLHKIEPKVCPFSFITTDKSVPSFEAHAHTHLTLPLTAPPSNELPWVLQKVPKFSLIHFLLENSHKNLCDFFEQNQLTFFFGLLELWIFCILYLKKRTPWTAHEKVYSDIE